MPTAIEQFNQLKTSLPDAYIAVGRTLKQSQRITDWIGRVPDAVVQEHVTDYEPRIRSLKAAQQSMKAANVFSASIDDAAEHIDTWMELFNDMQRQTNDLCEVFSSIEQVLTQYHQQQIDVGYAQTVAYKERYHYACASAEHYRQYPLDNDILMQPVYRFVEVINPYYSIIQQEVTVDNARELSDVFEQLHIELERFEQADSCIRIAIRQGQQTRIEQLLNNIEQVILEQLCVLQEADASGIKQLLDTSYQAQHMVAAAADVYTGTSPSRLIDTLERMLRSLEP